MGVEKVVLGLAVRQVGRVAGVHSLPLHLIRRCRDHSLLLPSLRALRGDRSHRQRQGGALPAWTVCCLSHLSRFLDHRAPLQVKGLGESEPSSVLNTLTFRVHRRHSQAG